MAAASRLCLGLSDPPRVLLLLLLLLPLCRQASLTRRQLLMWRLSWQTWRRWSPAGSCLQN